MAKNQTLPQSEAQQSSSEASVENSLCSVLFMATQQMYNSKATAPNDLFLLHTETLSSTVWVLAHFCWNCRVPPCSSYLPSNSISQTHLKSNLFSYSLPPFFLPSLSLCNFSYLILVKLTESFWMWFNKSHK